MKIAIIGSGISGLTISHHLHSEHEITVYEANNYIGGHSNTVVVKEQHHSVPIDTGFIVFNDWTYPNFESLLKTINVNIENSEMSFSAKCSKTGFEWCGNGIKGLVFNQSNWHQIKSYQILFDFLRFNWLSKKLLDEDAIDCTLGKFLKENKFSQTFIDYYIIPMGAAIWSSTAQDIHNYPAHSYLRFFRNHGLLNISHRPQWKTISGGSKEYVSKLTEPFSDRIKLNCAVEKITRQGGGVTIHTANDSPRHFDHVFMACHSDQALQMLERPTALEHQILKSIEYQFNLATLHTDSRLMPSNKDAWSSWNYLLPENDNEHVKVTYYMNRLQNLNTQQNYFVSLNLEKQIDPSKVIRHIAYMHPVFNQQAINAQNQFSEINGIKNTWYCGAYWRNGFHEDGVWSAKQALKYFNLKSQDEELYLQRAS